MRRRLLEDADYQRHVMRCARSRQTPDRPQSPEQWEFARRFFPWLGELYEAPADPEPFDEEFQQRLLATIVKDTRFRRALVNALKGAQP